MRGKQLNKDRYCPHCKKFALEPRRHFETAGVPFFCLDGQWNVLQWNVLYCVNCLAMFEYKEARKK